MVKSILDQILDNQAPTYGSVHTASAEDPGEDLLTFLGRSASAQTPEDWRGKGGKAVSQTGLLAEAGKRVAGDKAAGDIEKTQWTSAQVRAKVSDLFHLGMTPTRVAAEMDKLAELHAWDRQLSADAIKDMTGTVGFAFIEPNHFNTCQETYDKIKSSGKLAAMSVKRIAACGSCSKCVDKSHCSLFKRPIVASGADLSEVLEPRLAALGKKASKAVLADLHDGREQRKVVTPGNHDYGTVAGYGAMAHKASQDLDMGEVAKMASSKPFFEVYNSLLPTYGKVATQRSMKAFIASLKTSGAQVNVNLIDCKFLTGKLAASNAIVGSSKCAGCVKRCDMHCGLTGGTLLSFPGMASLKSSKKAHAGAKEGGAVLAEWELDTAAHVTATHGDIDVSGYTGLEGIEAGGQLTLE